ncbi:Transcriptional activator protein acu-15 [Metarhizium album ARSEF 1941]|uniref:Transcriptional activator protein acu-15 n=1 Tax=Metarhizium album (strain ARSEF 1941) TaxID=1081103 RepID=A0A0B2WMA3_METAS|nr:Transcriptional activator protein acu-15 [Metarhizium album ARSEF 1941]KHN95083.1 Transcriptional activator protein acu-15 [Metarhizium album ARSEF 1941]
MPGILPMKVIKVGNSAQSRIAQACDRCRSKKIRCDGVRPTCSQCANVGFECRTSDKLSRRAFPRGYTESLEERVRQLETEVRELKDLLDEKDEKIDMLSAVHGNHHHHHRRRQASLSSAIRTVPSPDASKDSPASNAKGDTFRVQGSPLLFGVENSDSYFMGPSSGRSFITSFKQKLRQSGKSCNEFNPEAFLHVQGCAPLTQEEPSPASRLPPRIFSDRCVNVYFQEWAPLFPVLHKPTFLRIYEEFVADPEKLKCHHKMAQLHLVFSIAGVSSEHPDSSLLAACEKQWTKAIESVVLENTMGTLQCFILALLYCAIRADNKRVQHFKGLAVGLSHRLGLHQNQKRFSFGALTLETRKKVFWSLYTLDCFTAATLGLPKMLKEVDVHTEYPSDTDDEYITEKGFQPTLPGEHTRLSSALALFRATRIMAAVLEKNYPAVANHELSLQQMATLDADLDAWYDDLPAHLRLNFSQDKPSTDVTGSRSPILALAYYYIRTLIYRPAVGSSLGPKAAPAMISIADSSKRIIQIIQLLEERNMSFSFCLNKFDLLALCGLTLLYQVVDLKADSKLSRDIEKLVNFAIKSMNHAKAPGCIDLARIAGNFIRVDEHPSPLPPLATMAPSSQRSSSEGSKKKPDLEEEHGGKCRMAVADVHVAEPDFYPRLRQSLDGATSSETWRNHQGRRLSLSQPSSVSNNVPISRVIPNLDYLSLNNTPSHTGPSSQGGKYHMQASGLPASPSSQLTGSADPAAKMAVVCNSEWEALLGSMDNNVYDAIYGGASLPSEAMPANPNSAGWSPDSWDMNSTDVGDSGRNPQPPQSVLSMSDDSLSSGEEVAPSELGLSVGSAEFNELHMPAAFAFDLESFSV